MLAGHLAVLLVAWEMKTASPRDAEARRTIMLRLIPVTKPPRVARAEATRQEVAALPRRARDQPADREDVRSVLAPVAAAPTAAAEAGTAGQGSGISSAPPGWAASAPLALKPGREVLLGSLANPAVNDPRSNSPKPTFEERIAMGLDPELCLKMERLPDGSVRRTMSRLVQAQTTLQNTHGVGARGTRVCE